MLMFFKYSLVLISLSSLTACWPSEDSKKNDNDKRKEGSSKVSLLPTVNNSLSTESPVGIWMLEITADQFQSHYFYGGRKQDSTDHTSKFHSYKFLTINKDANNKNSFIINDCIRSLNPMPLLSKSWQLNNSTLSLPELVDDKSDTGLFIISNSSHGDLKLVDNIELSGIQYRSIDTSELSNLDTGTPNPLMDPAFYFNGIATSWIPKIDTVNLSIKGVKVSDKTSFNKAPELHIQLNLPNTVVDFSTNKSPLKCISSTTKNKSTRINNTKDNVPKIIDSSSNIFTAHFSNDSFFLVERLSEIGKSEDINNLIIKKPEDPTAIKFSSNCLENKMCKSISAFEQSSTLNTQGQLSTEVQYTTSESVNETINFTISIN